VRCEPRAGGRLQQLSRPRRTIERSQLTAGVQPRDRPCAGHPSDLEPFPHDPKAAKELFSKIAWPQGRLPRIATSNGFLGIAKIIATDIREALGVEVEFAIVAVSNDNPHIESFFNITKYQPEFLATFANLAEACAF